MKKLFSTIAILTLCVLASFADRAMPGVWQTKKLADGTEVRVELCGDEFAHFWRTVDGVLYVHRDGVLYPVTQQEIREKAQARRNLMSAQARRTTANARGTRGEEADDMRFVGSKKCIIILVEFSDKSFSMDNPQAYFHRMANEPGFTSGKQEGSVHDYFMDQSNGLFDLTFDVVGPVKMPLGYAYYGADEGDKIDVKIGGMFLTAINRVNSEVTWSDYDWDGDGEVEQIYFIYAGGGQATGAGENTIWPHKWELGSAVTNANGQPIVRQDMRLNVYACSNEILRGQTVAGIGTICHEFSHCLGLPDTYDTSDNSVSNYGMGSWDVMCSGNYGNDGFTPVGYNSWEKMMAGWLRPVELTSDVSVTDMLPLSEGGQSYIIYNPANRNEYYMLENRDRTSWDTSLPAAGMMILHVDYDEKLFHWYNSPNGFAHGNDHQRMTFFPADNIATSKTEKTDVFPYGNLNVFSNYSTPAAVLHNANADSTYKMNIRINRIHRAEDGTMSFVFGDWAEADPQVLFAESFDDCNGTGANDDRWATFRVAMGEFRADNEGWEGVKIYGGRHCARVGEKTPAMTDPAHATTPEIEFSGDCTLSFRAAPFASENTNMLTLTTDNPDVTFSQVTFPLQEKQWTTCTMNVNGKGKGKIKFSADCRLYLDDILVRDNTVTGIEDVKIDNGQWTMDNKGQFFYDMTGRRVTDTSAPGIYVRRGKKIIK